MTTSHVVFGDDSSPGADVAWLWIISQRWPGWRLSVVTADRPPLGEVVAPEDATLHPVDGEPSRALVGDAAFDRVGFLTARLDPRVALASVDDAGLVVVGAAKSGIGRHHIGSTAEWLLQDPDVATVVARSGRTVRSALVCADGSDHAVAAAASLAAMPWIGGTRIHVLSVDDGRTDCAGAVTSVEAAFDGLDVELDHSTRVARSPHREIIDVVATSSIDLVVLGNQGLSGLRRRILGSTASAVVRFAPCSVLVAESSTQ